MLRQHVALNFSCIDYFLSGIETAIGKLQKLFFIQITTASLASQFSSVRMYKVYIKVTLKVNHHFPFL